MSRWYHALVQAGLWRDVLGSSVALGLGHVTVWVPFRKHRKDQKRIADLLSTETPGGLADVVSALQDQREKK